MTKIRKVAWQKDNPEPAVGESNGPHQTAEALKSLDEIEQHIRKADLTLIMQTDSGYLCKLEERVSPDQWRRIWKIVCENPITVEKS